MLAIDVSSIYSHVNDVHCTPFVFHLPAERIGRDGMAGCGYVAGAGGLR
jgi:hypothetical protein